MRYIITAFIAACAFSACQPSTPPAATTTDSTVATPTVKEKSLEERIQATYKGDFGGSPIYITINYCSGTKIAGYNTHKGLRRNISGSISNEGDKLKIKLSEPGDHEFDGVFTLVMDTSLAKASGTWKPVNSKTLSEKQLSLTRMNDSDEQLGYLSGNHCDVVFDTDGSCTLNYYDKVTDTTFSQQMNTLRGTWERQPDNKVLVNWQPNPAYPQRSTIFTLVYEKETFGAESHLYLSKITGDDFEFFEAEGY